MLRDPNEYDILINERIYDTNKSYKLGLQGLT